MRFICQKPLLFASFFLLIALTSVACAEPVLQLYIEGAVYDTDTESWYKEAASDGSEPVRVWAIGYASQAGELLDIVDVKLSIAYSVAWESNGHLPITLTPSTTGGYEGYTDSSTPVAAQLLQYGAEGTVPMYGPTWNSKPLPAHGEYGPGIVWQEFLLGNFDLNDSPIADFSPVGGPSTIPTPTSKLGQINVYEVWLDIPNAHDVRLHFDLYNHILGTNRGVFAPFSHDADGTTRYVPGPSALVGLCSMGLTALGLFRRRRSGAPV